MAREGRIPAIEIKNAKIIMAPGWRGFGPEGDRFGNRGFNLIIDDYDYAQKLIEWGYNLHLQPARDGDDAPRYRLPVACFGKIPPKVTMVTRKGGEIDLDESTAGCLDTLDFAKINVRVTPGRYDPETNGGRGTGVKAWLSELKVWVDESDVMADDDAPWDDED